MPDSITGAEGCSSWPGEEPVLPCRSNVRRHTDIQVFTQSTAQRWGRRDTAFPSVVGVTAAFSAYVTRHVHRVGAAGSVSMMKSVVCGRNEIPPDS